MADGIGTGAESEFMKQFAGSGASIMLTLVVFSLLWGLRKLCNRETKCKSHLHCCCCDIDLQDKTLREAPDISAEPGAAQI